MDPGKLFVGGISWDTNEDHMREYFQTYGEVLEATIMKDRTTGRARGFGFIVFSDPSVAERVIKEKHMIGGREVEAKKAVPRDDQYISNRNKGSTQSSPTPVRTKKIFVGGLPSSLTEIDFKKYFDQFGTITDAVVMYDHNTQRPRGFGFITFDSEEAVDKVLLTSFHELNGKMVEVKRAVPKELSPGPPRALLAGSHSGNRVTTLFNRYNQMYDPSSMGGYIPRTSCGYETVSIGRDGLPIFNRSMGPLDPGLSSNVVGNSSFNSRIGYGRGLDPFYSLNSNRYSHPTEYSMVRVGSDPILGSANQNIWGDRSIDYITNYARSNNLLRSGGVSTRSVGDLGRTGTIWGSSFPSQGSTGVDSFSSQNVSYPGADHDIEYGEGYGRGIGRVGSTSSYAVPNYVNDRSSGNLYSSGSVYGNTNWRSSSPLLGISSPFGLGTENPAPDIISNSTTASVRGGSINRPNRVFGDA